MKPTNMLPKLVFSHWKQESRNKNQYPYLSVILSIVFSLGFWLYLHRSHFYKSQIPSKRSFFGPVLIKLSVLLLLVACGSYPKKNNLLESEITAKEILNPYFSDPFKDYVYKARIKLQKQEFGGLFIVKKLGPDSHRVVITTEMGSKILDFSFEGDKFTVNYLLEEMDKKILVNTLKKDFRTLITENPQVSGNFIKSDKEIFETKNEKEKYYYIYGGHQLEKIIRTSGKKEKTNYLFLEATGNLAKEIKIEHKSIPLEINLNAIK